MTAEPLAGMSLGDPWHDTGRAPAVRNQGLTTGVLRATCQPGTPPTAGVVTFVTDGSKVQIVSSGTITKLAGLQVRTFETPDSTHSSHRAPQLE